VSVVVEERMISGGMSLVLIGDADRKSIQPKNLYSNYPSYNVLSIGGAMK